MSRKLFFEDGSSIELLITSQNGAKMAEAAYQRLIEFIDDELMDEFEVSLHADDLDVLGNSSEEVDLDEVALDEDELDDFDDELMDDEDETDEDWGLDDDDDDDIDDDDFTFR